MDIGLFLPVKDAESRQLIPKERDIAGENSSQG